MEYLYQTDTSATNASTRTTGERPEILEKVITAASSIRSKISVYASGPASIFNPTNVRLRIHRHVSDGSDRASPDMALLWRSRDNRKGRVSIALPREAVHEYAKTSFTASRGQVFKGLLRMFTVFPYFDMAYLVGLSFALGSAIFVANGFICLLPLAFPDLEFEGEPKELSGGLTSFTGALAYQIGATLAYLEAVNDGSFHGSAMKRFIDGKEDEEKQLVKVKLQSFFQHMLPTRRRGSTDSDLDLPIGWPTLSTTATIQRRGALDLGAEVDGTHEYSRFRWCPTWTSLRKRYIFEIGWLACTVQFISATLYMIVGTVDLPGIISSLKPWQENYAYWFPNIVASAGFILASVLFTLETQDKWYKPQPRVLGWWIGLFALLGSIGFELCAAFGPASYDHPNAEFQLSVSTTWASGCFLIASMLQWYEAVNKSTIEELHDEPTDMKAFPMQSVHV